MNTRARLVRFGLLGSVLALGCGDSLPRQKTYPVSGQVLLNDKPAAGAALAGNGSWQRSQGVGTKGTTRVRRSGAGAA